MMLIQVTKRPRDRPNLDYLFSEMLRVQSSLKANRDKPALCVGEGANILRKFTLCPVSGTEHIRLALYVEMLILKHTYQFFELSRCEDI